MSDMNKLVSIIVPIYNVEQWLPECLESLINQTYKNIEIICVDDGSTDGSVAVVRLYARKDARVKLIQQVNSGTVIARKKAVDMARGDRMLFVDPDDYLALDACECLLSEMDKRKCDILQFGVTIHETTERSEDQRKKSQQYFNPQPCAYEGTEILKACYLRTEIAFNVIFRMFDGNLVRRAFKHIPEVFSINETDVFAFFFLAYYAKKFVSISDRFYHYRYGIGISTKKGYDLSEFKRVLCKFDTLEVMRKFATSDEFGTPDTVEAYEAVKMRMTANACGAVFARLRNRSDTAEAFRMVVSRAGVEGVVIWLGAKYRGKQDQCAEMLLRNHLIGKTRPIRPVQHVALFYYHMSCGGIQRVVQQEIVTFLQLGFRVTLFLEEHLTDACYEIPEGVEVVYLPRTTGPHAASVAERCKSLSEELAKRDVDVFYTHAHVATTMLWDMLICKWQFGIPFVLHYHNLFSLTLYFGVIPTQFPAILKVLKCVDRVVALSRIDAIFFSANEIPAVYLQNPIDAKLVALWRDDASDEKDPNMVLWVGRMSWEKKPTEAIKIFNELHRMRPETRLVMVGAGSDEIVRSITDQIAKLGLQDVVSLEGAQLDTYRYYRKASVFLSTSLFEGFQLTVAEALCAGVPIVAYAIPHLDLYRGNPALIQVAQGDYLAAAEELRVLLDSSDIQSKRVQAKSFIGDFCTYDFKTALKNVISGWEPEACELSHSTISVADFALCVDMIVSGIASACTRGLREINGLKWKLDNALKESAKRVANMEARHQQKNATQEKEVARQESELAAAKAKSATFIYDCTALRAQCLDQDREIKSLKSSVAYRVGMFVTWPARRVYRGIKCWRENGFVYTLRRIFFGRQVIG